MALPYYVEPEYWVEGYAEGDAKIASSTITATLATAISAQRIQNVTAAIAADLAAFASAEIIRFGVTVNCSAAFAATVVRVSTTSASTAISAIFIANARLKWEPELDTPETWNGITGTAETWSAVADTSETWTEIADTSEIWTDVAETAETWTEI